MTLREELQNEIKSRNEIEQDFLQSFPHTVEISAEKYAEKLFNKICDQIRKTTNNTMTTSISSAITIDPVFDILDSYHNFSIPKAMIEEYSISIYTPSPWSDNDFNANGGYTAELYFVKSVVSMLGEKKHQSVLRFNNTLWEIILRKLSGLCIPESIHLGTIYSALIEGNSFTDNVHEVTRKELMGKFRYTKPYQTVVVRIPFSFKL